MLICPSSHRDSWQSGNFCPKKLTSLSVFRHTHLCTNVLVKLKKTRKPEKCSSQWQGCAELKTDSNCCRHTFMALPLTPIVLLSMVLENYCITDIAVSSSPGALGTLPCPATGMRIWMTEETLLKGQWEAKREHSGSHSCHIKGERQTLSSNKHM